MKKTYYLFFSILLSTNTPSLADDLLSVYQLALQNDPQFHAAQAEYNALRELKPQSISGLLPTISISGQYTEYNNSSSNAANYDYAAQGYSLNLNQPIYRHENFVAVVQANAQVAKANASFENSKQVLILRLATQYFSVLAAQDDLAFAKAERKAIKRQLLQTQQRFDVGLIAITDVHEAQAAYDQSVAHAIVAENALSIAHETLREITATRHAHLSSLSTKNPLIKPQPADITQWVKTAAIQNSLLMSYKENVTVAQNQVSIQRAGHYPTLDLNAKKSFNNYSEGSLGGIRDTDDSSISLQLTIPLFQGGLINSKTNAAIYRLTQARKELEQQRRATERQTRNAYLSVIANISQVTALKQALASSAIALEATQAGFEVGTRTTVDVLNSQRELFRAKRDYAKVRYNYALETLKLKYAAGTLSALDIKQLNPWLK